MIVAGSVLAMLLMGLAVDGFVNTADEDDDAVQDPDGEGDPIDQSGIESTALSDLLFAAEGGDPDEEGDFTSASGTSSMVNSYTPLDEIDLDDDLVGADISTDTDAFAFNDPSADDGAEDLADSEWASVAADPSSTAFLEVEELTGLEDGSEVSFVTDFDTSTDELVLEFDGTSADAPEIEVDHDSEEGDAVVLANGIPVTLVEGATELTPEHVRVVMSGEEIADGPQVQPAAPDLSETIDTTLTDGPQVLPGVSFDGPQVQPSGPEIEPTLEDKPQVLPGVGFDGPQVPPSAADTGDVVEGASPDPDDTQDDGRSVLPSFDTTLADTDDGPQVLPQLDPLLDDAVDTVLDPVVTVVDEVSDGVPLPDELTALLNDLMADMPDVGGTADMLDARADVDPAFGTGGEDAQTGTFNNDLVLGGDGQDALFGDEGDDTLQAGAGNDEVHGDIGDDALEGGAGIDFLDGGEGNDMLDGGADRDLLFGGDGDDVLYGGAAADFLQGGMGADMMNGGSGDDVLNGTFTHGAMDQDAGDTLWGGDGDDTLIMGQNDLAHGGDGADTFTSGEYIENADVAGHVADFNPIEDRIEVIFDPDVNPNPQVEVHDFADGSGADILLNGSVILSVSGAQGMDPGLIDLRAVA